MNNKLDTGSKLVLGLLVMGIAIIALAYFELIHPASAGFGLTLAIGSCITIIIAGISMESRLLIQAIPTYSMPEGEWLRKIHGLISELKEIGAEPVTRDNAFAFETFPITLTWSKQAEAIIKKSGIVFMAGGTWINPWPQETEQED